jgi:hypothetical protein
VVTCHDDHTDTCGVTPSDCVCDLWPGRVDKGHQAEKAQLPFDVLTLCVIERNGAERTAGDGEDPKAAAGVLLDHPGDERRIGVRERSLAAGAVDHLRAPLQDGFWRSFGVHCKAAGAAVDSGHHAPGRIEVELQHAVLGTARCVDIGT